MAPPKRAQPRNSWISAPTWALIDRWVMLHQQGMQTKQLSCLIGWQIASSLKGDSQQQAAGMAENIERHLVGGEMEEAWRCLKGWIKPHPKQPPQQAQCCLLPRLPNVSPCTGRSSLQGNPSISMLTRPTFRIAPSVTGSCGQLFGEFKTDIPRGVQIAGRAHQGAALQYHVQGGGE